MVNRVGNSFDNEIDGTFFSDRLEGLGGNDVLSGFEDSDELFGGSGNDELYGGTGDDDLYGGSGINTLNGGTGEDLFIMSGRSSSVLSDNYIEDFDFDEDRIDMSDWGVSDFSQIKALLSTNDDGNAMLNAMFGGRNNVVEVNDVRASQLASRDFVYSNARASEIGGTRYSDTLFGSRSADLIEGGSGSDKLLGGQGNDEIFGDSGNDVIFGGLGIDTLTGGSGRDKFVFASTSESNPGDADRITDFRLGEDFIDLSLIDALPRTSDNDEFAWIGRDSFEAAGELRYSYSGRTTVVSANLDTDSASEFQVVLSGRLALSDDDFFR